MIIDKSYLTSMELYPEVLDIISRSSESAIEMQILAAESLCKSYLFKYDLVASFGTMETPPTVESPLLKKIVGTIAAWYLLRMSAPNVDIELYKSEYDATIQLLTDVRDGNQSIVELPYQLDDPNTPEREGDSGTAWASNPKRQNFF